MHHLIIASDFGGSELKVIYSSNNQDDDFHHLTFSSEIEPISQNQLRFYQSQQNDLGLTGKNSNKEIWIESNGQLFALGEFAQQFEPTDKIQHKKYEDAIKKILGLIGLICQRENLFNPGKQKTKLRVSLAILLPYNELGDRQLFKEELSNELANFSFKNQLISGTLKHLIYLPEAGGLARKRLMQKGKEWLQEKQIGVLMLGHRNLSFLKINQGHIEKGNSPAIGFYRCLDQVVGRCSDISRNSLAKAMFEGVAKLVSEDIKASRQFPYSKRSDCGRVYPIVKKDSGDTSERSQAAFSSHTVHPEWKSLPEIQALCTARAPSLREKELEKLDRAIATSINTYADLVCHQLNEFFKTELDEVIVSGGVSLLLQPELENYFNCQPQIKATEPNPQQQRVYRLNSYIFKDEQKNFTNMVWGSHLDCLTLANLCQINSVERFREMIPNPSQLLLTTRFADVCSLYEYLTAVAKI